MELEVLQKFQINFSFFTFSNFFSGVMRKVLKEMKKINDMRKVEGRW